MVPKPRTEAEIEELARKTIGLDEVPDEPTPIFYLRLFTSHLNNHPNDNNFIVEFAEPDKPKKKVGGNGFGTITCMEDHCWVDVVLSADPTRLEGGRGDGFGSFSDYQDHCRLPAHVRGRTERCKRLGISTAIPPQPSSSSLSSSRPFPSSQSITPSGSSLPKSQSQPIASSSSNRMGGALSRRSILDDLDTPDLYVKSEQPSSSISDPSATKHHISSPTCTVAPLNNTSHALSSPSRAFSTMSMRPAFPLGAENDSARSHPSTTNVSTDVKPAIHTSPKINRIGYGPGAMASDVISISSGSDDEVLALSESEIPEEYKKVTNKDNPISLSDDEDDYPSSQNNKGKSKQPTQSSQSSASSRKPLAPIFNMNKHPKRETIAVAEDDDLDASEKRFDEIFRIKNNQVDYAETAWDTPGDLQTAIETAMEMDNPRPIIPRPDDQNLKNAKLKAYIWEESYLRSSLPSYAYRLNVQNMIRVRLNEFLRLKRELHLAYCPPPLNLQMHMPALQNHLRPHQAAIENENAKLLIGADNKMNVAALGNNAVAGPSNGAAGFIINRPDDFPNMGMGYPPMPGAYGQVIPLPGAAMLDDDYDYGGFEPDRPVTNEGLQGFFDENLKDFLEDTTVDDALQKLGLNSLAEHLPGLRIQLMPHQVMGVTFMIEKEKEAKYRGGINGDSMGLGKTVQSIALMAANPSQDRKIRATLIVAPLALLTQWKAEIESKTTNGLMKVVIHHGSKRTHSANNLKNHDVVLTTYGTLVSDFGTEDKHKPSVKIDDKDASDEEEFIVSKKQGPLMKVKWYRVILDEAHNIRNKNTRAAKACFALQSHLRWCLTGTLIMNSLDDIYPYLRFTMISPSKEWEHFRDHISKVQRRRPKLATNRVQAILRTCCIRRHKDSELNGKKLLELPPKITQVVSLDFTEEERQIYRAIECKFQVKFNSFLKKGTVMKHYSIMLVMLMRLRQLTDHPWLLRRNPGEYDERDVLVTDEDLLSGVESVKEDNIGERTRAVTLIGQDAVDRICRVMGERQARLEEAALFAKPDPDATKDGECSICMDILDDTERVTPCSHSFCAACVDNIFNAPSADPDLNEVDVQAGRRKCPMCRSIIDKKLIFRAAAFLPEEEEDSDVDNEEDKAEEAEEDEDELMSDKKKGKRRASTDNGPPAKKRKNKGKGKAGEDELDSKDAMHIDNVLPSTKMKELGDIIDRVNEEDPTQKIIVFSQFVQYIDLCALFLGRRNVPHVTYVGSMKQDEREDAIAQFNKPAEEEGSPRVILMSLKCGGVGLNLCAANHVICLDLAWNAATENQAVDRAHRIGQTKEVHVHRLVITDTVEQRIMALQESKQALSDGAMGEGAGGRLGRLSVRDLIKLFGVGGDDY